MVQTDAELSEIVMRAFIARRVELVAQGQGDVTLVGSSHSADTLRIKEFLTPNGHPYTYIDLKRDADVESVLPRFGVAISDTPVLICPGQTVLRNPTNREIANCLGFNEAVDETRVRDIVIVGAGPPSEQRVWRNDDRRCCRGGGVPHGVMRDSLARQRGYT